MLLKGKGIISPLQKQVLEILSSISDSSYFYLTGGTALAEFYFGHRRSYDLDIFTSEEKLVLPFSRVFENVLHQHSFIVDVIRRFSTFTEFQVANNNEPVKVQLAYDTPFRIEETYDSEIGIKVNSYKDIIVDKLLAFVGRIEPRDAIDLFFILQKENIFDITNLAAHKDPGFDLYWLAIALEKTITFPDDIKRWPVEMILQIDIKELQKTFHELSMSVMNKINKLNF